MYQQDIIEILKKKDLTAPVELELALLELYHEIDVIEYHENIQELFKNDIITIIYEEDGFFFYKLLKTK